MIRPGGVELWQPLRLTRLRIAGYIWAMTRADRTSAPLVPTLLLAIVAELLVHRVLLELLKPEVLQPESEVFRLLNEGLGPVVFFFASFVALACCAWLLVGVALDESLLTVSWRIGVGLISCVFLPVATVGVIVSTAGLKAPSRSLLELHPYLNMVFVILAVVIVSGLLLRRGPLLPKLGLVLLLTPMLLFAYFSDRTARIIGEVSTNREFFRQLREAAHVPRQGLAILSAAGVWCLVFFYPLVVLVERDGPAAGTPRERLVEVLRGYARSLFEVGPLVTALLIALAFGVFFKLSYQSAVKVVEAGFAFYLPSPSVGGLLLVASLFLFSLTVAGLAWRPGPTRLVAAGLLAVVVAAFRMAQPLRDLRLTAPLYYLVAVVGLVVLGRGIVGAWALGREAARASSTPRVPDHRWRRLLETLASSLSGSGGERPRISTRREGGLEISEVDGPWRSLPMTVRLGRKSGRLLWLSIALGQQPDDSPDWAASVVDWEEGDAVATDVGSRPGETSSAERRLEVLDRARLSERLLQAPMVERLQQTLRGKVEIWRGVGLRFRVGAGGAWPVELLPLTELAEGEADSGDVPLGRLLGLCDLLYDLAELAGVVGGEAERGEAEGGEAQEGEAARGEAEGSEKG